MSRHGGAAGSRTTDDTAIMCTVEFDTEGHVTKGTRPGLDLSPAAMKLYERLLREPQRVPADGRPLDGEVAELVETGFARLSDVYDGRVFAVPPARVLATAILREQAEIVDVQRRLTSLQQSLLRLQDVYEAARPAHHADRGIQLLTDSSEIAEMSAELTACARQEFVALTTAECVLPQTTLVELAPEPVFTGRHVNARAVYATSLVDSARHLEGLHHMAAGGEEVRLHPDIPVCLTVADRSTAIVSLGAVPTCGVVLVQAPALVSALAQMFEWYWSRAVPLASAERALHGPLTPTQHRILGLLAGGERDEQIAARLGVNVRTVRRHIEQVLSALHADTRFAAGVEAGRRGWLDA